MARPSNRLDYVLSMYDWAGIEVVKQVLIDYPNRNTRIIDIGAGWGKYGVLLKPHYDKIDALDVWWIEDGVYNKTYIKNVAEGLPEPYTVAIMGDVFEHLTREDARKFLENVLPQVEQIYIVVPWQMQQEAVDGNPHEEHQQEDLTPELMAELYPELKLLNQTEVKGLYIKA